MGTDKALLSLHGIPLIQRIARTLQDVFERVLIVSDRGERYRFLELPIYPDIYKRFGPLGGIHSAFVNTKSELLFVVACDLPFINSGLINYVCDFESAAHIKVASSGGKVQPLCGLYSRAVMPQIEENLKTGLLRLDLLFERVHTTIIPITPELPFYDTRLFTNFNTPQELDSLVDYPH